MHHSVKYADLGNILYVLVATSKLNITRGRYLMLEEYLDIIYDVSDTMKDLINKFKAMIPDIVDRVK